MKKRSLITKLALSGVALAATAATLATSTYAWYTANTAATANQIKGSSASATADGSILVSATGTDGTWSNACTPTALVENVSMQPVTYNSEKEEFTDREGSAAANTDYLSFKVYFKTTKAATEANESIAIYLKSIELKNTTAEGLPTQDNLVFNSKTDGDPTTQTYSVDGTRALNLVTKSNNNTSVNNHLDLTGVNTALKDENGIAITSNAHKYYNHVMGENSIIESTTSGATALVTTNQAAITLGNIVSVEDDGAFSYSVLEVTFYLYLDGWDQYCFDACKGQTFGIALGFTSVSDDVAIGTDKN